ncbi:MAG TPA: sialidase family protein [Gaiellales bacterium]|nr:sialidase family protein [Gaiellales bacterium]
MSRLSMWTRAAAVAALFVGLALAAGQVGVRAATTGWQGEALISVPSIGDGWEPAVAADPSGTYVYSAWMQYASNGVSIYYRVSADNGTTWGAAKPLCSSCGKGEYDVTLATASNGAVYGTFMQGNHIEFTKSSDHGATWTAPVQISGGSWADKPWMTAGANGQDIYVMWASHGNTVSVSSHNAGASWSAPLQITNEQYIYYYPNGGTVLPNGTVVMSASEYPEKGNSTKNTGPVPIVVFRSTNGGSSWTRTVVDTLNTGATFATSSVTTVASDASGNLIVLYSGSTSVGANGKVYVRRSTDSGATWSAAAEMTTSAGGADATSVAAAGSGSTLVITWMDKRGGGWNVWERQSTNGGSTWTADAKVSDATTGAAYKTAAGFGMPYGDYDMVAINSAGKAVAVMGEGDSTQTHGDIWVNKQT